MQIEKWQGYLEALAFSLFMLVFGYTTKPYNPLHLGDPFPWIWFFPVLTVLRYGWLPSFIPVLTIVATMLYTMTYLTITWSEYQLWLLGGVTLTLICGEFQSLWHRKQEGLELKTKYTDEGLQFLSRSYGTLKLSHDRLEESMINSPTTMRQALGEVRKILTSSDGKLSPAAAKLYLELFAMDTFFEAAAIYIMDKKKLDTQPIASLGEKNPSLLLDDILIKKCLETKETVYSAVNILEDTEESAYIAVVPMVTSSGEIIGLLTITKMQFLMLNDNTLKNLSLLVSYAADEIDAAKNAVEIQKKYPTCPSLFASELSKLRHIWNLVQVNSSIIAMYVKASPIQDNIITLISDQMRGLDVAWKTEINDAKVILILFPLMTKSMYQGYITRIDSLFFQELHIHLNNDTIFIKYRELSEYKNNDALLEDLTKYDDNI